MIGFIRPGIAITTEHPPTQPEQLHSIIHKLDVVIHLLTKMMQGLFL